jgi:hypothetical protein
MLGVKRIYALRKPRLACTHSSLIKYVILYNRNNVLPYPRRQDVAAVECGRVQHSVQDGPPYQSVVQHFFEAPVVRRRPILTGLGSL